MVKNESGFTLVELIVAVTLFTWAMLALLGANILVIKLLAAGDRAATASFYARERLETLRGVSCSAMADGSETRGGAYDLKWTLQPDHGGSARQVQLLVTYPGLANAMRTDTVESSVLCVR
jgi:prepilin-type N-terminal cleavage/methylation domain-containing protein